MKSLTITPPLLNSSNPWCTTLEQLQELYDCHHTGAVTTRTSLLNGFPHDSSHHQFTFFNPKDLTSSTPNQDCGGTSSQTGSLNTLGYSPTPLREYLSYISAISSNLGVSAWLKPFIISVTGSSEDVVQCYKLISTHQAHVRMPLAMEVNLSCPNIPGHPPPAYSATALSSYLTALKSEIHNHGNTHVPIGIKTPPYTYHDQFHALITALRDSATAEPKHVPCPVSFITATNTLGSSLLLCSADATGIAATIASANGTGVGGLAGSPLHPLALGNVFTIKSMLDQHESLAGIQIIGVGGVEDAAGFARMRGVGAAAVGVGTALGRKGVGIFEEISIGLKE